MRVRCLYGDSPQMGEVVDFTFDEDGDTVFTVVWYGRPGTHQVLAAVVEAVK